MILEGTIKNVRSAHDTSPIRLTFRDRHVHAYLNRSAGQGVAAPGALDRVSCWLPDFLTVPCNGRILRPR
jgi:hypothetical protein